MFNYTAVIIEPRKHMALRFVIQNFLENLSPEWGMVVCHGTQNVEYVKAILHELNSPRIVNVVNLHVSNLTNANYSKLLVTPAFYNLIPTETFLIFQTDSIILAPNKELINTVLEYDYVGAPWRNGFVGNGGLSLRKKSKMLEIIQRKPYMNNNEDEYFSKIPSYITYHIPSFEIAKRFSVEMVFYEAPFGIHNCWKYLSSAEMDTLTTRYPEIKTLMELQ
jgi:hypothetical protein